MASSMKNVVEPVIGWLFVVVVVGGVAAVLLAATRPRADFAHRMDVQKRIDVHKPLR